MKLTARAPSHKTKNKKKDKDIRTSKTIREKGKVSLIKKLIAIFFILLAVFIILHTSLFNVKNIVVEGNEHLSKEDVIELSKINLDENINKNSKKEIRNALLESAYIEDARIKKELPKTV